MTIYEAIEEMRKRSKRGAWRPFSFSFMSYSITRGESEGEVEVNSAILYRNPLPGEGRENRYKNYMLIYLDTTTGEVHTCWQPLLMTFEGKRLEGFGPYSKEPTGQSNEG